jgi:hypothetical protein
MEFTIDSTKYTTHSTNCPNLPIECQLYSTNALPKDIIAKKGQ